MGGTFDEKRFRFAFGTSWRVLKFDDSNTLMTVRDALQLGDGSFGVRSVDFVALDPENRLWLVEATDCADSTHLKANVAEARRGKIVREFGGKVLCTVGTIVGAARFGGDGFDWKAAAKSLHDDTFRCVLFSEEPPLAGKLGGRKAQRDALRSALGWLTRRAEMVDTSDYRNSLPDLTVSIIRKA